MGRRKTGKKKLSPEKVKSLTLKYFLKNPKKRLNAGQLIKKLKVGNNRNSIQHALDQLLKEDFLRPVSESKYVLNRKKIVKEVSKLDSKKYVGRVDLIRSGAAYIIVENLDQDVYIPQKYLGNAMNGDTVEITVTFYRSRKPEGRVTKILKRKTNRIMGTLMANRKYNMVQYSAKGVHLDVFIKNEDCLSAKNGDKVMVQIISWGTQQNHLIWGKVIRVINDLDDHNWAMESILIENGFASDYPPEVMNELRQIPDTISDDEIIGRRDFRDVLTFTIDPDTAKDFDDAISFQRLENGLLEVGVHIADVTHYLKEGTALDREALERSTSVYLVDRCIAMLPEKLSNNLCSLVPEEDRLVFSAVFQFDEKYNILHEWFGKSIIHSDKRYTYDEAQEALDDNDAPNHKVLTKLNDIAHNLRDKKMSSGAIAFESDEFKFQLDENNVPVGIYLKERKDVHMLIEDFMLLANKSVAKYISTKSSGKPIPFVYRVHDLPDIDRLVDLKLLMEEYGVSLDLSTPEKISKSFNKLAEAAKKEEKYKLLMRFAIRTMAKAIYTTDNIGHYGLHFDYYTHFTSPIRRYADVLVHRILEKNLEKEFRFDKARLEKNCIHISSQERKAMEAERDSVKYKQVEYMQKYVGDTFTGTISGMIEKGIFVEAGESKAEGLITFQSIRNNFRLRDDKIKAVSLQENKSLKLGDTVKVKILSTDLTNRQIEMELVDY